MDMGRNKMHIHNQCEILHIMVSINLRPKDELSNINYDLLAKKYQMYKYYPKYFHNEELKTPDIKEMIIDKPIYSSANEHLDDYVNPGVMKIYETELDLDSGKLTITKERKEKRKEKREEKIAERAERREEREEKRKEKREERKERRESRSEKGNKDERKLERKRERQENKCKLVERRKLIESKEKPGVVFKNPFGNEPLHKLSTTYSNETNITNFTNYTQISMGSNERKNSITSRLVNLLSNTSDDYDLERTNSFDQTKSNMTKGRKRLFSKKRYSDQIGTYLLTKLAV
ncbi:hypothetical protein CLIB1444_06S03752 [[Candida] jaroonii]|uniref:Uncharacterized protein n=1 Tax=[Candida] jaroonii TaxID=467808 RepID=A0ACA9Y940_9ASCO|nr:hypothetical protein CLIB1444_06S03752 [[Candida] jaroonii]